MSRAELKRKKRELEAKIATNKEIIANEQREGNKLRKELVEVEQELEMLERQSGKIAVSDHAVVRYMERVSGIDIEAIRQEIRESVPSRKGLEGITDLNVFKGAHKLVIKNNTVVTVAPK